MAEMNTRGQGIVRRAGETAEIIYPPEQHLDEPNTLTPEESFGHASTGGAAVAGAVTGAVFGLPGGPAGVVIGAVGGAVAGTVIERAMHGEAGHEHEEGDEAHYRGDHECSGMDSCTHDHRFHYMDAGTIPEHTL